MLTEPSILAGLRQHHLFDRLPEPAFAEVCKRANLRRLEATDSLFHQGDLAERFYVLLEGQIKLIRTLPEGQEKLVEVIQPGQSFAEALVFLERPCPINAQALCDALLLQVPRQALLAEVDLRLEPVRGLVEALHHRLSEVGKRRTPQDDLLPFMPGIPALDAFPVKTWHRLLEQTRRHADSGDLSYRHAVGEPELRQAIATYLRAARGVRCTADQVVVASGGYHLPIVPRLADDTGREREGDYVCRGRLKDEVYCCNEGERIDRGTALWRSCGLYFDPSRVGWSQRPLGLTLDALQARCGLGAFPDVDALIVQSMDQQHRRVGRAVPDLVVGAHLQQGLEFEQSLVPDGNGGLCTRHRASPYQLAAAGLPQSPKGDGVQPIGPHLIGGGEDGKPSMPAFAMASDWKGAVLRTEG